jgi:hypothetical protein
MSSASYASSSFRCAVIRKQLRKSETTPSLRFSTELMAYSTFPSVPEQELNIHVLCLRRYCQFFATQNVPKHAAEALTPTTTPARREKHDHLTIPGNGRVTSAENHFHPDWRVRRRKPRNQVRFATKTSSKVDGAKEKGRITPAAVRTQVHDLRRRQCIGSTPDWAFRRRLTVHTSNKKLYGLGFSTYTDP